MANDPRRRENDRDVWREVERRERELPRSLDRPWRSSGGITVSLSMDGGRGSLGTANVSASVAGLCSCSGAAVVMLSNAVLTSLSASFSSFDVSAAASICSSKDVDDSWPMTVSCASAKVVGPLMSFVAISVALSAVVAVGPSSVGVGDVPMSSDSVVSNGRPEFRVVWRSSVGFEASFTVSLFGLKAGSWSSADVGPGS